MNTLRLGLLILLLLFVPAVSRAQDTGHTGVTISAPSSVGIIWQASERVAIRPEFSFSTSEVSSDDGVAESTGSSYNVSISGLLYLHRWDDLRAYVCPRFSYTHASTTLNLPDGSRLSSSDNNVYGFAGSFGAEYALGRRFAVFGETGLSFSHQTSEIDSILPGNDRTIDTFGVRNAVGVVFYF
jgi:hypothetical protein